MAQLFTDLNIFTIRNLFAFKVLQDFFQKWRRQTHLRIKIICSNKATFIHAHPLLTFIQVRLKICLVLKRV